MAVMRSPPQRALLAGGRPAELTSCGSTTLAGCADPKGTPNRTRKSGRTFTVAEILVSVAKSSLLPVFPLTPIAKPPLGIGPTGPMNVAR